MWAGPVAKAIVFLLLVIPIVLAVAFVRGTRVRRDTLPRHTSACGLVALLMLLLLGSAWPSPMTLAAVFSIPAVFILGRSVSFPYRISAGWKTYTVVAVVLSPVCFGFAMGRILLVAD